MFTTYLFAFEATSALLVIAVVGAVVLARRPGGVPPGPDADTDAETMPAPITGSDTSGAQEEVPSADVEAEGDADGGAVARSGAEPHSEEVSP